VGNESISGERNTDNKDTSETTNPQAPLFFSIENTKDDVKRLCPKNFRSNSGLGWMSFFLNKMTTYWMRVAAPHVELKKS
jgi:hypothetical protein